MKKREIRQALDALKNIKMPKIEDKVLRNKLIRIHLKLLAEFKKYDSDLEDARIVFLSAYKEEADEVGKLQNKLQTEYDRIRQAELAEKIAAHSDYLEAVKAVNDKADAMGREEIELEPVSLDDFLPEYEKQGYDPAIIEGLYPIFSIELGATK